ncbi:MAG: glycosyltransferase family 2 protein [Phycisphaerales bacterium]|nr:MAG: glycosyltransferase family 2 protein [Phycisphaerales bacterium]
MITYNRPVYTRLSLERLLTTADERTRVWVWHNGDDQETLGVVRDFEGHPRLHRVHHSPENVRLREPTNWLYREGEGQYVSKVDDDCLVPHGWIQTFREMHEREPKLGVVACWHFQEADYSSERSAHKTVTIGNGHRLIRNPWVGGSGYLLKRACIDRHGILGEGDSATEYWIRLARAGWLVGWAYPLVIQDHMDDPRSAHTMIRSDEDLERMMPLSARNFGAGSLAAWDAQLRRSARLVQKAPYDPRVYAPWRRTLRRRWRRVARVLGIEAPAW